MAKKVTAMIKLQVPAAKATPFTRKLPKLWHAKVVFLVNTLVGAKANQACMPLSYAKSKKFAVCTVCSKSNSLA